MRAQVRRAPFTHRGGVTFTHSEPSPTEGGGVTTHKGGVESAPDLEGRERNASTLTTDLFFGGGPFGVSLRTTSAATALSTFFMLAFCCATKRLLSLLQRRASARTRRAPSMYRCVLDALEIRWGERAPP